MCVWTRLDIAHICPGCVPAADTAHVSALRFRQWRESARMSASPLLSYKLSEAEHFLKWRVCVCFQKHVRSCHTHSLKPRLGLFTSIFLSFIFPPRDGKLLLSLVQLMPHIHAKKSPATFSFCFCVCVCVCVCTCVWQDPWHGSSLKRLSDSRKSAASASPDGNIQFSLLRGEKKQQQQKKKTGKK